MLICDDRVVTRVLIDGCRRREGTENRAFADIWEAFDGRHQNWEYCGNHKIVPESFPVADASRGTGIWGSRLIQDDGCVGLAGSSSESLALKGPRHDWRGSDHCLVMVSSRLSMTLATVAQAANSAGSSLELNWTSPTRNKFHAESWSRW
jgi:hypothetical protein